MRDKMRMRNKHRKSSALCCNAGSTCSLSAVWTIVALIFVMHIFSFLNHKEAGDSRIRLKHFPLTKELEEIEEEHIQRLPPRRRSSRAAKRRGFKKPSLVDEFLDDSSPMRPFFFPDQRIAIDPSRDRENDSFYFFPGRQWLDSEGSPIQAHGGGVLYEERSEMFYWYGENKDGPTYHAHEHGAARVDVIGITCYSSKDLWKWIHEGIVLQGEDKNFTHDLYKVNVLERPKVIYNDKTMKYVMWMHVDDTNYTKASVGVAVSDWPSGPFTYLYSKRPHGFDSRDMTVFKDEDGTAYLIYSSEGNSELHIGPLTDDYLDVTGVMTGVLVGQNREAPAIFKHKGTYYMITSGCTGWAPNEALAHAAASIMGPWETIGNPCVGGNQIFRSTTFFAQSTFVLPLPGIPGSFIFMADRWNPVDLKDSRYVWLPLKVAGAVDVPFEHKFEFPLWSRVSIFWHRKWRLPEGWKTPFG